MTNANVVTWTGRSLINTRLNASNVAGSGVPLNIGWGTGNGITAAAFSDVNMFLQSNLENRVAGSVTFLTANQLADVFQIVGTLTANGAKGITEVAVYDTASAVSPMASLNQTGGANSSQTSIIVAANPTGFPSSPNTVLAQWDNEVILITGGATTTWTIARAQLGSTAAAHGNNSWITLAGDGGAHAANATIAPVANAPMNAANGGSMLMHADFPVINLANNDSIQFTLKLQLT